VALFNLCSSFGQFGFEFSPRALVLVILLLLEQSEGFLGAELGDSGEILDSKPIQDFGSAEFTGTEAQWALNGF
jgi:hypothetical protein